jgi:hypothetical protein
MPQARFGSFLAEPGSNRLSPIRPPSLLLRLFRPFIAVRMRKNSHAGLPKRARST